MANPVVKIRPVLRGGRVDGYSVWCFTGTCELAEHRTLKTEAQAVQRDHIRGHRSGRIGGAQ